MKPSVLQSDGFAVLPKIISPDRCLQIANELSEILQEADSGSIGAGQGSVVGGRNLATLWPGWREITGHSSVVRLVNDHLGNGTVLVRILYFDKPPGRSWSLSLHRDRAIAVKQHHEPPDPYSKPTRKAGVPHVIANEELLREMLTLRLHLDAMHTDNGPLVVVPGSHRTSSTPSEARDVEVIQTAAGDLFVMRPLLLHGSRASAATTTDHRRVVHLELAPANALHDPYRWYCDEPVC